MRELLLHVGMHKTGTTSIQNSLFAAADRLGPAGFSYFDAAANHSQIVRSAFTARPELYHVNRRKGLVDREDALSQAARGRERLLGFLRDAPGPKLVVSGEGISVLAPVGTRRMLAAFRPLVDRITVIGFVRAPRSFLLSSAEQRIREGQSLEEVSGGTGPIYRPRFATYLEAPEVDAVRLHPYRPDRLVDGCSVATFLELCGAPPELRASLTVKRSNERASRLGVVLALAANAAVPALRPDGTANPARSPELARFLQDLKGARCVLPPSVVAGRLAHLRDDIAWMEEVLGEPFPESEKTAGEEEGDALRAAGFEELMELARAVNALLLGKATAAGKPRAARPPAGGSAPGDAPATGAMAAGSAP